MDMSVTNTAAAPVVDASIDSVALLDTDPATTGVTDVDVERDPVQPRLLRLSVDRDQILTEETLVLTVEAEAPDSPDAVFEILLGDEVFKALTLSELLEGQFRLPVLVHEPGILAFEVRWADEVVAAFAVDEAAVSNPEPGTLQRSVNVVEGSPPVYAIDQRSSLASEPQLVSSDRGGASDEAVRSFVGEFHGAEVDVLIASDADAVAGVLHTSVEGSVIWMGGVDSPAAGEYQASAEVSARFEDRWVLQALEPQRTGELVRATLSVDVAHSALGVAGSGLGGDDAVVTRVVVVCNGQEAVFSARQRALEDGSLSDPVIAVDGDQLLTDRLSIDFDALLGSSVHVSVGLTSWIEVRTGVADGLPMDLSLMQTQATLRWGGILSVTDANGVLVDTSAWSASGLELLQADRRALLIGQSTDDQFGAAADGQEGSGAGVLPATAQADVLLGRNGADRLDGLGGADMLVGGHGDDLMIVDDVGDRVVELDGQGNDTVWATIDFVLPEGVENLVLLGTQSTASPAGATDRVAANGATSATGNAAANWIAGNANDNMLDGAGAADTLIGGPGDDTYYVDNSGDLVVEQPDEGAADVVMSTVTTVLPAEVENLVMLSAAQHGSGNALNNTLTGNAANNWLDGAGGDDVVMGLAGDDTLEGQDGDDRLEGGDGQDTLIGGAGQDVLLGGAGDDAYWLSADDAPDTLVELVDAGVDTVYSRVSVTLGEHVENLTLLGDANLAAIGNAGENWLVGNAGNNWMTTGAGEDLMAGGAGSDTYVYRRGDGDDRIQEQVEQSSADAVSDQDVLILESVYAPDSWMARIGDDLIVSVFGLADVAAASVQTNPSMVAQVGQVKVLGWYAEQAQRLERIELADGVVLSGVQAERLVDALATLVRPDQGSDGQSLDNLLAIDNAWISVLYGV